MLKSVDILPSRRSILCAVAAVAVAPANAVAQKSADTLRFSITDMFGGLDPVHFPHDEAGAITRTIYEGLIAYDERQKRFVPRLAKSWNRIDERTLEFELRDDVLFHNGDKFDANDVKYTVEYVTDPQTRVRFKEQYSWIESIEILDPYRIRLHARRAQSNDVALLAYRVRFYNSKVHSKMENKSDYGRVSPITTGPYKVVSFNPSTGVVLERFDQYYDKSVISARGFVKRLVGIPMPDRQTQLAQFIAGNVDLLRDVPADMARDIANLPDAKVTVTPSGTVVYVTLDAAGRSANKAMTDVRVRKAFIMAVNRTQLASTIIPGGDPSKLLDAICAPTNIDCAVTVKPVPFDPDGAKKLLAEAGYPNGLDMDLAVYAPIKEIGEAIAGQARKVGIRASARPLPLASFVRMRSAGELTAFCSLYPTSGEPTASSMLEFFFTGDRDYWKDPVIDRAREAGITEFDAAKRAAIYTATFDRVNELGYILPVSELPTVWAHSKSVRIEPNPLSATESRLGDWYWN